MRLRLHPALRGDFPGLGATLLGLEGVSVHRQREDLEDFKIELSQRLRGTWDLESLKDEARVRAYRDFFWRVGIDPTKIRPAAEALLRRLLRNKPLPTINTLVDAYNLVSMETRIALAAFDNSTLSGDMFMRYAVEGEEFLGIGMKTPVALRGKEIVVEDDEGLLAVYPYRDAERTKVTTDTSSVVIMVCGVPGIQEEVLEEAYESCVRVITRFCGGVLSPTVGTPHPRGDQ